MSTVEEITAAIEQLPADQVVRVRDWLAGVFYVRCGMAAEVP